MRIIQLSARHWNSDPNAAAGHSVPETGARRRHKEIDCPACKYGTLVSDSVGKMKCIDCGETFLNEDLERQGVRHASEDPILHKQALQGDNSDPDEQAWQSAARADEERARRVAQATLRSLQNALGKQTASVDRIADILRAVRSVCERPTHENLQKKVDALVRAYRTA